MNAMFSRMAVIGVGLLGGSMALAMRHAGLVSRITGAGRSHGNLEKAMELGIIDDFATDPAAAVTGADLVVLALPVGAFEETAGGIAGSLKKGCIVTDVGSVKGALVERLESLMPEGVDFVGAHPIAGGSSSGAAHARSDLFRDAGLVITPTGRTSREALGRVRALWESLGARVSEMDPHEHDRVFAAVSHMPHVAAYALVNAVAESGCIDNSWKGFLDITRIASSPPEVWRDILSLNRDRVLEALKLYEASLSRFRSLLEGADWDGLKKEILKAKEARERLENN